MFKSQTGLVGTTILIDGDKSKVPTFWTDRKYIIALETNILYRATVDKSCSMASLAGCKQLKL